MQTFSVLSFPKDMLFMDSREREEDRERNNSQLPHTHASTSLGSSQRPGCVPCLGSEPVTLHYMGDTLTTEQLATEQGLLL